MHPLLDEILNAGDYDALPESIKLIYSEREYLWLSDAQKARLVQDECEPEQE